MDDLRRILDGRAAVLREGGAAFDTSGRSEAESFAGLLAVISDLLARGGAASASPAVAASG